MERFQLAEIFKVIRKSYPNFDGSKENLEHYLKYLKDVPYEIAVVNTDQHITREKWPPTIAEIRYGYEEPLSKIVPSVEETHESFKQLEEWKAKAVPMPDHLKKELSRLVRGSRHPNS